MLYKYILALVERAYFLALIVGLGFLVASCNDSDPINAEPSYAEKVAEVVEFDNCDVLYMGDNIGEESSDIWVVKLYTDMNINQMGMLEGPGCVMQLALNAKYAQEQTPQMDKFVGTYFSQSNYGDFSANTFVFGYMDYIDLPNGRIERADATFFGEIAEGTTEEQMEVDLIDDGQIVIKENNDGTYTIEGTLVGKKCIKRIFTWSGAIEPSSRVEPEVTNSTLQSDLVLNNLTQGSVEDRGDYFYLKDESYRDFLVFLAEEGVDLSTGRPKGNGDVLRLELLVPWNSKSSDGIPEGVYPMVSRNVDTSIDKDNITPYHSVPGLPDRFSYPYWAGTWYVNYVDGAWGERFARIDRGTVEVSREDDGSYHIVCNTEDCSTPAKKISCDVVIAADKMKTIK